MKKREVSNVDELVAATRDESTKRIVVTTVLSGVPSLRLSPGQTLTGANSNAMLHFTIGSEGIQLSSNNKVENLEIIAASDKRVLFNDTTLNDFGVFHLQNLALTGVVQILASDKVRAGSIVARNVDIVSADARAYNDRPKAYGVEVVNGAFTIWNQQSSPSLTISADLVGISIGRPDAPVQGSGVLVSGASEKGGKVLVLRLETGAIYSNGGIAAGTPNLISAGVFTAYGAVVDSAHTKGPVTTYGPNDMVLDNWGVVDRWVSDQKTTSHGPSGIGFVNFGNINSLKLKAPIETFGEGARGFNVYSGTIGSAEFDRIVTHGNGSIGIQIAQPVGNISIFRGIETHGGIGQSLVKGVVTKLSAIALSVKPGGSVKTLKVGGGLITHGIGVSPLELHGRIETLLVNDGVIALEGENSPSQSIKTNQRGKK
jgi:hypothetical protein